MFTETIYNRNSQFIKYLEELDLLDEDDKERIYDAPSNSLSEEMNEESTPITKEEDMKLNRKDKQIFWIPFLC
jgi:ribosomal protein L14E/L6E/L27E